jgi:multidrug efflux pump subunit AcrB
MSADLPPSPEEPRGPLAWLVTNHVTANLLMISLLAGGIFFALRIKQEVFPDFSLDMVNVVVPYPGASPEEVEQGIVLSVEEAVRGLEGVKEVTATASEGSGRISIELLDGADPQKAYQEVQQEIDRIRTFPLDAEEPQVSLATRRREVLTIQVYGDASEWALRDLAEQVRDRLVQDPGITQVDLSGARKFEVRVQVSQETLRRYGLTLDGIARRIATSSVEIPAGGVDTAAGEVLLRVKERKDWAREFAEVPIVTTAGGASLTLSDLATVVDDFEDTDRLGTYAGHRAIGISVFRVGDQTPIGVSEAGREAMEEISADLPPGVDYAISQDRSDIYRQRLHLLLRNGFIGLCLVFLILGLFLELRLAFWVMIGIPTSFLGALLFLPGMGVTINMISMFAFIIALGIVVDDAIVAGENIYAYRQRGMSFMRAAIRGAREVALPITFSILTNVVAFLPLFFVSGFMGKIFAVIPAVVATVFIISWVESLLILPAHLGHAGKGFKLPILALLHRGQQAFGRGFVWAVKRFYSPFLDGCIRFRYLTLATGIALLAIAVGYARSGRMGMVLMPKVESDSAAVVAVLPYGSPLARTEEVRDRLVAAANGIADEHGGELLCEGVSALIEENRVDVTAYLTDPDVRPIGTKEFVSLWRDRIGQIPGLESLFFEFDRHGPGRGKSLSVELSHRDIEVLDKASSELAGILEGYGIVKDIDDGYTPGKPQIDFRLKEEGRSLGLTSSEVARQVRNAFYGAEALRQQRGRNEVKVKVRLPESERESEYDIETLMVRAPTGRYVPLRDIAEVERGRAYTSIQRRNGRRAVTVSANVNPDSETNRVLASLTSEVLPALAREHPGLAWGFEGRQADMRESLGSLQSGFILAMLGIYVLLAIPFRSYVQPVIVMMAIPFGIVGAVAGHIIMGYSMSVVSMMGVVALAGVVVNDALVMIHFGNQRRLAGASAHHAIHDAGVRRFRPILLTTLTTFGGLAPMIFETSRQARFLIPMALSLGFGIVFATGITLVIVPALYMIVEDVVVAVRWVWSGISSLFPTEEAAEGV